MYTEITWHTDIINISVVETGILKFKSASVSPSLFTRFPIYERNVEERPPSKAGDFHSLFMIGNFVKRLGYYRWTD